MTLYKQNELFATIGSGADERVFLGWDRSLIEAAVAHLCRDWQGGLLDLSSLLVVVPTRHAGRRLREALAVHVAQKADAAVIPPVTVPPEYLVQPEVGGNVQGGKTPATLLETLLAWIQVLRLVDIETCPHVFPVKPVERGFNWALQTAAQFERLRSTLGEAGLTIGDAVKKFGKVLEEAARWKEMAWLEKRMVRTLMRGERMDRHAARGRAAEAASLPEGITSVVVLAAPDPSELAVRALEIISENIRTEVVVYAPEGLSGLFDGWGRPLPDAWAIREIPVSNPEHMIQLVANPRAQASAVVTVLEKETNTGSVSVGVPDPEVAAQLESMLPKRGIGTFNPEGTPFARHELAHSLGLLADLLRTRSFRAVCELAMNPDFLRAIERSAGEGWTVTNLLTELDRLRDRHLPDTIDDLRELMRRGGNVDDHVAHVVEVISDWLDDFDRAGQADYGDEFLRWLTFLYEHREFGGDAVAGEMTFATIAAEIASELEGFESPMARAARMRFAPAEALELLAHVLSGATFYRERGAEDLDLQGWLELLWDDAPHLIVTGCNDGYVPDAVVGDPFLPNRVRVLMKLKDNERRFGRDAYLLTCLLESRKANGRVDLIVGRARDNGDPLRPSRLLFQCADEHLPGRALQLFCGEGVGGDEEIAAPWQRGWKLKPPPLPDDASIRSRVSVTAFAAYLSCPFRFYLSHGLRMREVEVEKQEMDPMEFGNLCHDAFERLGNDESMRDCDDEGDLRACLLSAADRYVERRYGKLISVPVQIQLESARQRLSWAAAVHANDHREGWRIERVESRFDRDRPWEIGGLQIRGTIDRIDRNVRTGALRVLDYKTSNKATSPVDAHLAFLSRAESSSRPLRPWTLFSEPGGRTMRWINLQLPLYVLALRREFDVSIPISAGYFNIPRAASETAIATWNGLGEEVLEQAFDCATAAAEAILAGEFWPPSSKPRFDDFRRLFFGDVLESVDPGSLI